MSFSQLPAVKKTSFLVGISNRFWPFLFRYGFNILDFRTSPSECGIKLFLYSVFLGLACLASSLSPDEGLKVFEELQKARKCFVLENELHIIYQVVPIYAAVGWPNLGQVHHIFSRFLNLRIFFTKFFCFGFSTK